MLSLSPPDSPGPSRVKLALAAGFGGLVVILLGLGFFAANALLRARLVASASTQIYLERRAALNEIRRSVFAAGSHIRDYLLDPGDHSYASHAERARNALRQANERLRRDQSRDIGRPSNLTMTPLDPLRLELAAFEKLAERAFQLAGQKRKDSGYDLLTSEISPARERVLSVLEQLVVSDQAALGGAVRETAVSLDRLQSQLWLAVGLSILLGSSLALLTYWYVTRLESLAAERFAQAQQSAIAMEQLSHRLLAIQEEERKSLARELHDEVGQSLGALLVDLGQARGALPADPAEAGARIEAASSLAEETIRSVRDLSLLLRPSILDDLGLVPALHWQAREISRRTGMLVTFHSDEEDLELDEERRTAVFRVVQEALNNAARHAGATAAEVTMASHDGRLSISVSDNGQGFEPERVRGVGILGMQERVAQLMGSFRIASGLGKGTVVSADLPLGRPAKDPTL